MKRTVGLLIILIFTVSLFACATPQESGGMLGGIIGGVAGALVDQKNPFRGAMIGAAIGAIAGGAIADMSVKAAEKAVATGKPVGYYTEDKKYVVYAEPLPQEDDKHTKCKKVRMTKWENGVEISKTTEEVCEGKLVTKTY